MSINMFSDIDARAGKVVLFEYIDQRPSVLSNVGMASQLVTYYRQKDVDEEEPQV